MTHSLGRFALIALFVLPLAALPAGAQIKEPPRAEKVDVQVRYRIRADRDERVRQYRALEKHLAGLGFVDANKDDPDRDLDELDPNAERFTGTVPGAKVLGILNDVRVQNILFAPNGFTYPDAPDKPVAVRLGLRTGLTLPTQQKLHEQTVRHLAKLGFAEALGYDHKGYTIVRGSIPYKSLDLLVKDVRYEPSGWFLSDQPLDKLDVPLRDRNPIRWGEVLPVTEFLPPYAPPAVLPAQLKFSADLRAELGNPDKRNAEMRVEVLLQNRIDDLETLRSFIQARYAGASLDGVVGNVASLRLPRGALAENIAAEAAVIGVRLPRQAGETVFAGGKGAFVPQALKDSRVAELQERGYTGAGVKVILVASDFSNLDKFRAELPKRTKLIDLTTELTPNLLPAPSDPKRAGSGTAAARALAAVAPDVELVLVRIDPGAYFQLYAVTRLARGDIEFTDALRVRIAEIATKSNALEADKKVAIDAYKAAFSDLSGEQNPIGGAPDPKDPNAPKDPAAIAAARRKEAKERLDAVIEEEKKLSAQVSRFNTYQKELKELAGANLIVNTLAWESGYPLDGLNDFAGTLDRLSAPQTTRTVKATAVPKPRLMWVQAGSAAGAAVWGGPFADANRDGLLEFVPFGTPLPADNWTPQLNFLGTRAADGTVSPEIAKDAKLRFVVQWREPADPNFPGSEVPLYPLTLRLLRQIDPTGEKRASDEMEEVARSVSMPNVIYRTRTFLVYEQMLEYTAKDAGRFALAMESPQPAAPLIPALKREIDISPRLVVETPNAAASEPRAVFRSFTNFTAGVGTPGDAMGAITVGTGLTGAQTGAGTGVLRIKPDVIGPSALAFGGESFGGEGIATAFAGGAAALVMQTGATGPNAFAGTGLQPGQKLELPDAWLRNVRRIDKRRP